MITSLNCEQSNLSLTTICSSSSSASPPLGTSAPPSTPSRPTRSTSSWSASESAFSYHIAGFLYGTSSIFYIFYSHAGRFTRPTMPTASHGSRSTSRISTATPIRSECFANCLPHKESFIRPLSDPVVRERAELRPPRVHGPRLQGAQEGVCRHRLQLQAVS